MPFCPDCGTEVSEETRFCPECGRQLSVGQGTQQVRMKSLAEAVTKQLKPVYCARCGSPLQVRKLRQNGFDESSGHPKYDVILACPDAMVYETDVSREVRFVWRSPLDKHTVRRVSKTIELNSDTADTPQKRGNAYDEMVKLMKYCPDCGKGEVEGMKFCPQCGQSLTGFSSDEKQRYVHQPSAHSEGKNWFERHLHWTAFVTFLGAAVAVWLVYGFYITVNPSMSIHDTTGNRLSGRYHRQHRPHNRLGLGAEAEAQKPGMAVASDIRPLWMVVNLLA